MIDRGTIGMKNIGLLEQHELAIRNFYAGIAEAIPEQSGFWTAMANEEDGHAKLVAALLLEVKAGNAFFASTAFSIPVLEKSTSTIRYQTKRLQEKDIEVKLHEHRRAIDVHAAKIDAFTQVREEFAKLPGLSV